MADETWSAKVSPELKKEIGELVEGSGLSSKEFLEQLINQYKIGMLQGSDAQKSEDIQQVTYHLDKIKASFVALIEKGIDLKEKFNESLEQESILHKALTDQQQAQIKLGQEERDKAILDKAELEKSMAEIIARNSELESNNKTHSITIQMQMDRLTHLESRIESVVELEQEVSRLNQENQIQVKKVDSLEQESLDLKRQLEITLASKDAKEKETIKATEQLIQVHKLELEKVILEAEKRMLEDNQRIRNEYVSKVESLTTKNQELTEKLHQTELSLSSQTKVKVDPGVRDKAERGRDK